MATTYIGIASGSPCVVPSWEYMTSPSMNNSDGSLYVLMRMVEMAGHSNWMLWRAALRFSGIASIS